MLNCDGVTPVSNQLISLASREGQEKAKEFVYVWGVSNQLISLASREISRDALTLPQKGFVFPIN